MVELEKRIAGLGEALIHGLAPHQWALDLLQTIPGLDMMGSAMVLVGIGVDMDVFGSCEKLASWAGLCPGNNESAGKRRTGRLPKGNKWLRGSCVNPPMPLKALPACFKASTEAC